MTQQQLIDAIEPLMDKSSTADVLLAIARVCNEKAEHLRVNWQDEMAAEMWDHAAEAIDGLTTHAPIVALSS